MFKDEFGHQSFRPSQCPGHNKHVVLVAEATHHRPYEEPANPEPRFNIRVVASSFQIANRK